VTLIPWETCSNEKHRPSTEAQLARAYNDSTPLGVLHKQSNDFIAKYDGAHYLVDSLCAVVSVDKSVILKSFEAHGVIELSPGMSKGSISFFSKKNDAFTADNMKKYFDMDVSKPNMTVVTHIDLDKSIEIIAKAKENLK
jgi:hypothetical protein